MKHLFILFSVISILSAQVDTAWVRRYDESSPYEAKQDFAYGLTLDNSGNVYVTGRGGGSPFYDYTTLKYSPAGNLLWINQPAGTLNTNDYADEIAVDNSGNVYVTGYQIYTVGQFQDGDCRTIKISQTGTTLWQKSYDEHNYPGQDYGRVCDVDPFGNLIVSGQWLDNLFNTDYFTIKYNSANGDTLWVRRYSTTGFYNTERAYDQVIDQSGNIYVTGESYEGNPPGRIRYDWVTIKYSPQGDTFWVRRYDGQYSNPDDSLMEEIAYSIAVDSSGNVYVTGYAGGGPEFIDTLINENFNSGTMPSGWASVNGGGNSMVWDVGNNATYPPPGYETYYAQIVYPTSGPSPAGDYDDLISPAKRITQALELYLKYGWGMDYSQPGDSLTTWVRFKAGSSWGAWIRVGSVKVADGSGTDSFNLSSYLPYDSVQMRWRYRSPGGRNGQDGAVDNVLLIAKGVIATSYDFQTVKYSPSGNVLWAKKYNGPADGSDKAIAIAVENSGDNIYVTGVSTGAGTAQDFLTIKYSPSGDTLWTRRYNGPGNGVDSVSGLCLDTMGNIYITGYSLGNGTGNDYATLKYSPSGELRWVIRYNGPANGNDVPTSLAVDDSGIIYVTGYSDGGSSGMDYLTIKYKEDYIPPNRPYVARVEKSENNVKLTWNKITTDTLGNTENMKSYVIYRNTTPDFIPVFSDSIGYVNNPNTTFTNVGALGSSQDYYYLIKAVDFAKNKSKPSNMGFKFRQFLNENPSRTEPNEVAGR